METQDGKDSRDIRSEIDTSKHQDRHAPARDDSQSTPKKRRKVNHGKSFQHNDLCFGLAMHYSPYLALILVIFLPGFLRMHTVSTYSRDWS